MSRRWLEGEAPDWDLEDHFLSAQQMSRRLATVIEGESEDPSRSTRPSPTASFPPRSSSMPTAAQQTPLFASQMTISAESTTRYPAVGETESLFGPFRPSTSISGPSRPSKNPATLDPTGSAVRTAAPGRTESRSRPSSGIWLMTNPPRPYRPPAIPESPPADSTVQYSASEGPASTTASLPPRLSTNFTRTPRTTLDSQRQTQSHTTGQSHSTGEEGACCLACAKVNMNCLPRQSQLKERCMRCRHMNIACIPIPAEHLPGYLAMKQLFREGRRLDGYDALRTWVESMEATTPFARIERQLFLLNRNVERLLNMQLRMIGEPSPRAIKEDFPEN